MWPFFTKIKEMETRMSKKLSRQQKKNLRNKCIKCGSTGGIWVWNKLETGRHVSIMVLCCECGYQPE